MKLCYLKSDLSLVVLGKKVTFYRHKYLVKMKFGTLIVILGALFLSCKKEDPQLPNGFMINTTFYPTPFAYVCDMGINVNDLSVVVLTLASKPFDNVVIVADLDYVSFNITTPVNGELVAGKYVFASGSENKLNAFYHGQVGLGFDIDPNQEEIIVGADFLESSTDGTLEISQENNDYIINYSMELKNGESVSGTFQDALLTSTTCVDWF